MSIAFISAVIPVYNESERALRTVSRLSTQRLPPGTSLEIIVVDDGSPEPVRERLRQGLPRNATFVQRPRNGGRSATCQTGIDCASGDAVLILDCDCEPVDDNYLVNHVAAFSASTVATIGPLVGSADGFWDRYQREASRRRHKLFGKGAPYAGTTANVLIRLDALRSTGGFEPRYRNYGFEDRDLLIKLSQLGEIRWCADAVVRHVDNITMKSVSTKMHVAGRESAQLFASQHPAAYEALGYAAIDAGKHPWLRFPALLARRVIRPAATAFDTLERRQLLPWVVGFAAARLISAASFMVGTASRSNKEAHADE